jgi:hypothetical protein
MDSRCKSLADVSFRLLKQKDDHQSSIARFFKTSSLSAKTLQIALNSQNNKIEAANAKKDNCLAELEVIYGKMEAIRATQSQGSTAVRPAVTTEVRPPTVVTTDAD